MQDALRLVRENTALSKDVKKEAQRQVKTNAEFIAVSRKSVFACSCGMSAEVWSDSGVIITAASAYWESAHKSCD